jgi:hypothetical protein
MAKRRGGGVYNRGGPYKFTARRRYALKRAQEISARKRKSQRNKKIAVAAGAIAGLAVAGYLGSKHVGGIRSNNPRAVRAAVQPGAKENTRIGNAISVGSPSGTRTTVIGAGERARAQATRNAMARNALPPHMGGPDRKIYNDDDSVNTTAMTNKGVRRSMKNARARVAEGTKTSSLKSTPGGTLTPPKANPRASRDAWSDSDWADALAFDTPVVKPISGGSTPRKASTPQRDPLHTLAKIRYDDAKLLGSGARVSGADDAFLANVGTSRKAPRKIKRK